MHVHNVQLALTSTIVVSIEVHCTATLAAVGAAAIPSAGMKPLENAVTNMLQAILLDQFAGDLAVILGLHLLLDRCQTAVIHSL